MERVLLLLVFCVVVDARVVVDELIFVVAIVCEERRRLFDG